VLALGRVLADSGYFADAAGAAQAVVRILAGRELGFGPIASMTGIFLVKGRITLSANLMAAAIRRSAKYNYNIKHLDDTRCEIAISRGRDVIGVSTFTIEDAKRAGLTSGANWRSYPKNMLFARAISNATRWFAPDLLGGEPVYSPDELGAEVDPETGEVLADDRIVTGPRLSPDQLARLQELIDGTATDVNLIQSHYGVPSLLDLTPEQHAGAVCILEGKLAKQTHSDMTAVPAIEDQSATATDV
jgi:hypothetical protein